MGQYSQYVQPAVGEWPVLWVFSQDNSFDSVLAGQWSLGLTKISLVGQAW